MKGSGRGAGEGASNKNENETITRHCSVFYCIALVDKRTAKRGEQRAENERKKNVLSASDELFQLARGGKMFSLSFDSFVPVVDRSYLFTYHRFSLFASPQPA